MRNEIRTQARELMSDSKFADKLMREEPNLRLKDILRKKYNEGLSDDDVWKSILDSSIKSRSSINKKMGLE